MTFKDWFERRGVSITTFGKVTGIPKSTISNIIRGKTPWITTVKRLVKLTKNYPDPISYDMFPRVFLRGTYKIITGVEAYKIILAKTLKRKK